MDSSLPSVKRVGLLMDEMTVDEKIGQMCMYVADVSKNTSGNKDENVDYRLGLGERAELVKKGEIGSFIKVPTYKEANALQSIAEKSRLKIPLLINTDAIHGHGMYIGATVYPTPICIASSFDPEIAKKIARFTAQEMRATGYQWTNSPNIEVLHDLRWGRAGETFGEDPYLVTMMGKAMLSGYQEGNFSHPSDVLACAKHFVGGGISINGLNGAPADISERSLYEVFFPPFEELVKEGVYSIMPAHNEINGIPCHAHKKYLTGLIRGKWGFKGIFVSDWMDIERLCSVHKIAATEKDADMLAVMSGIDVHMQGPGFLDNVKKLVEEDKIPMARIDESVRKILYAKFQLGLFENRYVDSAVVRKKLLTPEHLSLALDAARKSVVLLKNKNELLPVCKDISSVFITGPCADSQAILGDWSKSQPEDNVTTLLEGIKKEVSPKTRVQYLKCTSYDNIEGKTIRKAKQMAGSSNIAIVVVGENSMRFDSTRTSGENLDRSTLNLPGNQEKLVKSVISSGTPTVVVYINGGVIASEWIENHSNAIIEGWEPGLCGGKAIAEVIFGDYNPGGKMPVTVPRTVGQMQSFYYCKPSAFHRGRFYNSKAGPLYKFGYGLSYTTFKYGNLKVPSKIQSTDDFNISLSVQNTGEREGDEVVMIYINDEISSVTTPVKKLVAFKRVSLLPAEEKVVNFQIPNDYFKLLDANMQKVTESGLFKIIVGNNFLSSTVRME